MDSEWKVKYEKYKKTVKIWEYEFKKQNHRIPSKLDIKDAPYNVKQAYKMYYRMKTSYLTDTLTDILNDDDNQEEHNSTEFLEMSYNNASFMESMNDSISDSIHELLDPKKKLPDYTNKVTRQSSRDFEAISHDVNNDDVWNKSLNKRVAIKKEEKPKKADPLKRSRESFSLKMDSSTLKAPRNPRKALSKTFSAQNLESESSQKLDTLPDLETILLEKSRTAKPVEVKKVEPKPTESDIKTSVDNEWLNRNAPSRSSDSGNLTANFSTSSFGLSNLNLKSFDSTMSLTKTDSNVEAKYHTADLSDSEYIDTHENLKTEILPISKKRRLSVDTRPTENIEKIIEAVKEPEVKKIPEKPKRKTVQNKAKIAENVVEEEKTVTGRHFETDDDSDKDPTYDVKNNIKDKEDSPEPVVMKRKKSLIKRSKEGINKVTKKAAKLLTRNKTKPEQNDENEQEEEEQINFFVDTEINSIENIPRVSEKELKANEKLFGQFALQHDIGGAKVGENLSINLKTRTKKDVLKKKIESGTLNDNYVRVNLKKKVFVRGKKAFNFSRYKKTLWKKKKAEDLNDMRGCDGGVLKCFSCGGVGHFAQQCKQKGDSLLPVDAHIEDESPLPTLQQAAEMANDQKLLAHCNKPTSIPATSNEIWKEAANESDTTDEEMDLDDDIELIERELRTEINKENENLNANVIGNIQSYIGHKIPDDFLKKCDYFNTNTENKDEIKPYYELDADGTVPSEIPKEVYKALENFGHKDFRKGQEKAIMRILCGQSTLVTLSTGSGKSLCYQLPAYLYRQKYHCITLVISPLVSLMEDQVHGIPDFINAQCLHTNQTPKQREKVMEEIKSGNVEILLVSPEAVVAGEKSTGFGSLLNQLPPIAFACIDEAHCVSQWSHNFRPSYLMICRVLREKLGVKTVLGLTATATLQTRNSIIKHLSIPDGLSGVISDIPLPDNLILTVSKDENRDKGLLQLLRSERFNSLQSIIIYCTRRDECERIAGYLRTCLQDENKKVEESKTKKRKRTNWVAEFYHAGMPASRRRTVQNAFMGGDLKIVVATIAFGMGINKSDIRGIIHYNMPKNFESFVQEVGRAGRDGKTAHCHVFLDPKGSDLSELRRHIYANSIDRHVIRKLLQKVFVPCSCKQRSHSTITSTDDTKKRVCPGHEVCFSKEQTVQALDIPQENIETLLCYLELHEDRYIKVLGNAYTMCKIISYSGLNYMKQMAKSCPPLAMAIALELKSGKSQDELSSVEFSVVDIASAIGWDSGVVKYQLKQLEWTVVNGMKRRSPLTVSFSDLGFRIRSPGDLSDSELDQALDSLEFRTQSQERAQVVQLQVIYDSFSSIAFPNFSKCSENKTDYKESDELKSTIRKYFQTNLPMDVEITEKHDDTSDEQIISDIRQMIHMYPENNFSGRTLARIFHGISSPVYPAVIWGRCKYWRAYLMVSFHRLVRIGNREIVKYRLN